MWTSKVLEEFGSNKGFLRSFKKVSGAFQKISRQFQEGFKGFVGVHVGLRPLLELKESFKQFKGVLEGFKKIR